MFLRDVHDVETGFNVMTSSCLHDGKPNMAGPTTSTTKNVCTWNCPLGLDKLRLIDPQHTIGWPLYDVSLTCGSGVRMF